MEALIGLFALGLVGILLVLPVVALVALTRANRALRELAEMRGRLEGGGGPERARPSPEAALPARPATPPQPPAPPLARRRRPPRASGRARAGAGGPPPARSRRRWTSRRTSGRRCSSAPAASPSWSSSGFFVRYAWENDWVGPTGRVLSARGLQPGPAGGRAAADGPRVPAPRPGPGGRRLLRALRHGLRGPRGLRARAARGGRRPSWCRDRLRGPRRRAPRRAASRRPRLGGRVPAPLLLSTGEDRALSPVRLSAAARRGRRLARPAAAVGGDAAARPGGHPAPVRGLVRGPLPARALRGRRLRARGAHRALRGLGAEGAAGRASRGCSCWPCSGLARCRPTPTGRRCCSCCLSASRSRRSGRPSRSARRWPLAAAAAVALPFVAWAVAHYRPESFGLAAAWLVGGALLVALGGPAGRASRRRPARPRGRRGRRRLGRTRRADRSAGRAARAPRRPGGARGPGRAALAVDEAAVGGSLAALAVLAWHDRYFRPERGPTRWRSALAIAGLYVLVVAVRGLATDRDLACRAPSRTSRPRGLAWTMTRPRARPDAPGLLGLAAVVSPPSTSARVWSRATRGRTRCATRVTLGLAAVVPDHRDPGPARPARDHAGLGGRGRRSCCGSGGRPALAAHARLRLRRPAPGRLPPVRAPPAAARRAVHAGA